MFLWFGKKNGTLEVAGVVNRLGFREKQTLAEICQLPDHATYTFDEAECCSKVLKTTFRHQVVSREYTKFQAREKVRRFPQNTSLAIIVPRGANYAYDIISAVGIGSFIAGRKLSDIKDELETQIPNVHIPYSSLYDQQRKFLFYFGELHRASTSVIRDYLGSVGNVGWLIDGTLEPGTDVFLGVTECLKNILLDCFKLPTENEKDIRKCLPSVAARFGCPDDIIHDLSRVIQPACDALGGDIIQRICHFHFTRDVGSDLYDLPNELLSKQLKKLRRKLYLKTPSKNHGQWLRKTVNNRHDLMLEKLLNGQEVPQLDNAIWGRELFLSLNHWRLDYANDGSRQGYPFDPYLLYFHHLKNPDYVDLVIGNMEALPRKLADVGKCAGPFSRWLKQQDVKNICKINQNLLRKDDFIENLVEISQSSFNGINYG